jgi:polyhydroxybutyrate depolymerase
MPAAPLSRSLAVGLLGVLGIVVGATGCLRTDVFAVTDPPATDGSVRDEVSSPVTCPSPALTPDDTRRTVKVGSLDRSYVLHIPRDYDGSQPMPLIVDFHMGGDSGSTELSGSPYPAVTDPEGVVMAFPDGKKGPANAGTGWNFGPCCVENVDDVAFAKALVDQIQTTACIDPKRIYAVGVGTGGGMAYYLACRAAEVFAAVAPAAWDLVAENVGDCHPARPITVISFRGTADTVAPYIGGTSAVVPGMTITFLGAKTTFEKWAELDGCRGSPSAADSNGCSTYSSCQGGVEVVLCTNPEGHQDPGNASAAWPLLKRHSL